MKSYIAMDGQGCHYFYVQISDRRSQRKTYMEALYNTIEMVFKKLKYHPQKMLITITEVDDDATRPDKGQKQKRAKAVLENDAPREETPLESQGVSANDNAD